MESRLEHNHQVMVLPSGIFLFQCDVFKSSDIVESEVANSYSFASIFIFFFHTSESYLFICHCEPNTQ